jgi:hypothetical protein
MADTSQSTLVQMDPTRATPHLFEVSPLLDENRDIDIKPVYISLNIEPSAFPAHVGGFSDAAQSPYARKKGVFDAAVRGTGPFADRIWIFRGDSYLEYFEGRNGKDTTGEFQPIAGNWNGFPASFASGIDAVVAGPVGDSDAPLGFFKGNQYLRYDPVTRQVLNPAGPITAWSGLPGSFTQGIDAAIHGKGTHVGLYWLFKGGEFVVFHADSYTTESPAPIAERWGGWPDAFADGVDFAFYGTDQFAEHVFFFRGDQYIRYNVPQARVEEGPSNIAENWPHMQRFMPLPQLFIVERYSLRTFHGDMGRGDVISNMGLSAGERQEFYIVTKKNESTTETSATNILESSSAQAVTSFSTALSEESSQSGSQEKYDYGMDASFHGEAHATSLWGGEVDASLHVQGGSQDVRSAFAHAVNTQIGAQAAKTKESHKQQVSAEASDHVLNVQTETGFKKIIQNMSDRPANYVMFQLTQEYIVVLSLLDAEIAFHNGNGRQAKVAAIRDMNALLESCLLDTDLRSKVVSAIMAATSSVIDVAGQTRSLLTSDATAAAPRVDRTLTSTYELKNSAGQLSRTIEMPGIIMSIDRPVVLTPNTAVASLETS